jgi:hypothetical protein
MLECPCRRACRTEGRARTTGAMPHTLQATAQRPGRGDAPALSSAVSSPGASGRRKGFSPAVVAPPVPTAVKVAGRRGARIAIVEAAGRRGAVPVPVVEPVCAAVAETVALAPAVVPPVPVVGVAGRGRAVSVPVVPRGRGPTRPVPVAALPGAAAWATHSARARALALGPLHAHPAVADGSAVHVADARVRLLLALQRLLARGGRRGAASERGERRSREGGLRRMREDVEHAEWLGSCWRGRQTGARRRRRDESTSGGRIRRDDSKTMSLPAERQLRR